MNDKVYKETMTAVAALIELKEITVMGIGHSMTPRLHHKQKVKVQFIEDHSKLKKDDIVLVKVGPHIYLHLISKIIKHGNKLRFEISNNKKRVNGIVPHTNVFGVVTEILG